MSMVRCGPVKHVYACGKNRQRNIKSKIQFNKDHIDIYIYIPFIFIYHMISYTEYPDLNIHYYNVFLILVSSLGVRNATIPKASATASAQCIAKETVFELLTAFRDQCTDTGEIQDALVWGP